MTDIPRAVLSERFQSLIAGRRLRAAAFLTFQFDPGFFEQEILPAFLDIPLSHAPEIKLLGLADELRKVEAIAVYYDRKALIAGAQSSHLDIQRVPVSQSTGYFHPKVVLALLDDALLVAMLSANLTRSGWWENVEVAHIEEVRPDEPCSFRDDLLGLISRTRRLAPHAGDHAALDTIRHFLKAVPSDEQRMRGGVVQPRLYFGDVDIVEFLVSLASNRLQRRNLEIISPFFDDRESLLPITRIREAFHPAETRVFLPRNAEGEALCTKAYYESMGELVKWGSLPSDVMRLTKDSDRPLHAKVFRFFDPQDRFEAFFVGSPNLTTAALGKGGNIESGFFVEVECKKRPDWWMSRDERIPPSFSPRSEEDALPEGRGFKLSVRYRWSDETASCRWEDSSPSPPLTLLSHGFVIASLLPVQPGDWQPMQLEQCSAIAKALVSGSFLTVRIEGEPDTQILVEEEQMTHKPSLMARISATDILRYWTLLSAEQKKEFLEEHAGAFDDPEIAMWLGSARPKEARDSFFSTFAEVYVAFGSLERAVRAAMEAGRKREAIERLFGRRFDSLPRLIEQVREESDSDNVRRYIVLLCARQLLDRLGEVESGLLAEHRTDVRRLRAELELINTVRESFTFGMPAEREQFFIWFDRWFLRSAEPVEETTT